MKKIVGRKKVSISRIYYTVFQLNERKLLYPDTLVLLNLSFCTRKPTLSPSSPEPFAKKSPVTLIGITQEDRYGPMSPGYRKE
ncbi:MAG: hypothetical protein WC502_10960 [Methanolinea sp.]|jgi:hypothetical protein|nr:hypothetical protein [Methanolinea sp.]